MSKNEQPDEIVRDESVVHYDTLTRESLINECNRLWKLNGRFLADLNHQRSEVQRLCEKLLEHNKATARESVEESGWVIELAASEPCNPQYWAGSSLWIPDHLKAIRFARKQDAQQAADFMLDGMKIRICEHGWTAPVDHINDSMRRIATKAEKAFPDGADSDRRYGYITGWQEAVRCKGTDIEGQS